MYVLLVFSSQRFLKYFLVVCTQSLFVVSFAYEFRVLAVKNFKSLLLLLLDTSDTKTAHNKRSAYLEEEEEDKEEDKTGVSIARSSYFCCLIFAFLVGFSSISLTLYRSDLPPARSVRILFISSLC